MQAQRSILFVGGGSGGHIYPNLAVAERLRETGVDLEPHFVVSNRPLDAEILKKDELTYTATPAKPFVTRPTGLLRFYRGYRATVALVKRLILEHNAAAMIATGGFVSAPAVSAAARSGLPVALVNLDAAPGKANRFAARKATELFSVYPCDALPAARPIGMPLRRAALATVPPEEARQQLGLQPESDTLLVFAGSQGGGSINQAMIELTKRCRIPFSGWQVIHLTGPSDRDAAATAYERAGISARVESFRHEMGLAWASATLAICRAGAGSVAEAWANRVPTVFLPYPYHKDQHQRLNARPLVDREAALMLTDLIDPTHNADQLEGPLHRLISDAAPRRQMRARLEQTRPTDGAQTLADWVAATTKTR